MVFDQLVALNSNIEISPSTVNPFHALILTTKSLREEVEEWAKKRPDIVNDFPYGYYVPSQTTFIVRIDHRWKKRVKHRTVSGSHVTYKRSKTHNGPLKTKSIDYTTRKDAWYSFCRTRRPHRVAETHMKIEISLSKEFMPRLLGPISQKELWEALMIAQYYPRGPWASMSLFLRGTMDQMSGLYDGPLVAQMRDLMYATQKINFDKATWQSFRDFKWPDGNFDALEYPLDATYWVDDQYKTNKRDETGAQIYVFGGQVMEFAAESAEDMRRGPVSPSSQSSTASSASTLPGPSLIPPSFPTSLQSASCL
jgi:hypothetical protein